MNLEMHICPVCGKEFQAKRKDHIYCSKPCRSRACYLRHREYYLEYGRKYFQEHKERCLEYRHKYQLEHKEKFKQYYQNHRARKKRIELCELDMDEFIETCTGTDCPFNFNCFHCPAPDCIAD